MVSQITLTAAGRQLNIGGDVPVYLDWFQNWNADTGAVFASMKDLPTGSVVLDVGANIGLISCSLAAQRPDLRIVAIEPVPPNVECLRRNVFENQLTNVEVVHAAVSNEPGVVRVNLNGPWSVVIEHGEVEVPAITLDQFVDRQPAFVKIDTEGWEPYVIAGAAALLSRCRPRILMEFNSWALLAMRHDPIAFAISLWDSFDLIEQYCADIPKGAPTWDRQIVHDNVAMFHSVSDVLMRPKADQRMPSLQQMIYTPAHIEALRKPLAA